MTADPHPFYAPAADDDALYISHGGHTADGAESGSWAAYRAAHRLGFRAFQVDLVATGDCRLVSRHTVFGRVRGWERIAGPELDDAIGPDRPTLLALMQEWPTVRWNIEVKSSRCLEPLSAVIADHPHPESLCVSAPFHTGVVRELRRRHPGLATNASLTEGALIGRALRRSGPIPPTGVQLFRPTARPTTIDRQRRAGRSVQVWPVNDADVAIELRRRGATGFIVDELSAVRGGERKPSGNT